MSLNNSSHSSQNSLQFDQKSNSEEVNNLNSKLSNQAEPSFSTYDRDDSLHDALSFDAQTPFKHELNNQEPEYSRLTQNNLNSFRESLNDPETNRYSLIDLEYIKSSKAVSNTRKDDTDLLLDLKDTSIDEILLIADDTHTARNTDLSHIKSPSKVTSKNSNSSSSKKSKNRFQSIENFKDLGYFQDMRRIEKTPSPQNETLQFNDSNELNNFEQNQRKTNEKSNLQHLKERINSLNLNDKRRKDDGIEIMKTPQPDLIDDSNECVLIQNNEEVESKNEGAFKLYTTSMDENFHDESVVKIFKDSNKSTPPKKAIVSESPFFSIDKKLNEKNDDLNKSKRGPVKKYRSGSTNNLNSENRNKKPQTNNKNSNNKTNSERIRPNTQNEITYSLDSDESTIVDNLINDPERLKKKLKQSRIEREQLNQLQQNYVRLLQQYAEAENFIDAFRLNAQMMGSSNNTTPVVKGSLLTNESKSNAGYQPNYTQPSICSSTATLSSNQLNEKTSSLNGSKAVLIGVDQFKQSKREKAQSNENLNQNKEFTFKSQSSNNFQPIDNLNRNKSQSTVYVIPTKARSNSGIDSRSPTINENSSDSKVFQGEGEEEENIIIDQTSTLGILVQIKVLEDKMQSFMTLVNENQLNKFEQRQVYDSIRNDYQVLIQNYSEIRSNNSDGLFQEQIEMDVDLNKELGKMKTLLNDIVHKMNDNLIDEITETCDVTEKNSLDNSSIASFDNRDEILDQYNRLLDVFKDEKQASSENISDKGKNNKNVQKQSGDENVILSNSNGKNRQIQENGLNNKNPKQDQKRTVQSKISKETSESTSEINKQVMKNNIKILNNKSQKANENLNKQTQNKKLSRISVDRAEIYDDESTNNSDKNLKKNKSVEKLNQIRTINNNRRLTKMSNESSTSTLSSSESESTQVDYFINDKKSNFRNYIDEIEEEPKQKHVVKESKKSVKNKEVEAKQSIVKGKNIDKPTSKGYPKHYEGKKLSPAAMSEIGSFEEEEEEEEITEQDTTILKQEPVQKYKKTPEKSSYKKSVSMANIYDQSKNNRFEAKQNSKVNKKVIDLKNLPVAKAYEGSDSLEDLDSSLSLESEQPEYAMTTVVKNENLKHSTHVDKRPDLYHNKLKSSCHKHSEIDLRNEKSKRYEQIVKNSNRIHNHDREYVSNKNKRRELDDDSTSFKSDVESVIEKRKALKTSKRDLMQKLAEEVEFLKQEILKKNREKSKSNSSGSNTESERKKQRSDYFNSDTKDSVSESQLSIIPEKPILVTESNKNVDKHMKSNDIKLPKENQVLVQNNQKILVIKNEFGKKQYFCLIDENQKSKDASQKNLKVKPLDSTNECQEVFRESKQQRMEKSKYFSVSNLVDIKENKKITDDYFSDEEFDGQIYNESKHGQTRIYTGKDRRYQSTNNIFDMKQVKSLNDFGRQMTKNRSHKQLTGVYNRDVKQIGYPIRKEMGKNQNQIPIVIGKPVKKTNGSGADSRECLIILPVNNPDLIKNIPVNLIPYSVNDVQNTTDDYDRNFEASIKNIINPKSIGKFTSNQHINTFEKNSAPVVKEQLNDSSEKKSRRVRYYIREYSDVSTVSDNETMYRRYGQNENCNSNKENDFDPINLDILVDQALTYAHSITNNARRLKYKLTNNIC